jgi:hypothetical protein
VFQEVPASPEELAKAAGIVPEDEPEPAPPADAEPVVVTDSVRHEYDGGRLVAIEIEEAGGVTRLERGPDGWSVHPG